MYHFKGKISWFKISWHQHISKKLGQGHVYHCVASPLLFITVCKRLGTEETSCSSLGIGMLSHSCLIQASSCSTVVSLFCGIFLFMMCQMFSMGERSGLQAGDFSTQILLLRSHDVVIDAVCSLALSCWKMQGLPWKRQCLDGSICCSRTWIIPFSIERCLSRCVSCPCHTHSCNPIPSEMHSLSSLVQMTWCPSFPKTTLNFASSDHRTVFHFATVHFKWALAQRKRLRFWIMFRYGFYFDL